MSGRLLLKLCSVAVPALIAFAVHAADSTTRTEAQHARHEHYEALGDAFKAVRDKSRSDNPDWDALTKAAAEVNEASIDQQRWFPKGSGPEAGKTRALPEVWSKPDDFKSAQRLFAERAQKLLTAVHSKDPAQVQSAFKEVGGACKNCHDTFRAPED